MSWQVLEQIYKKYLILYKYEFILLMLFAVIYHWHFDFNTTSAQTLHRKKLKKKREKKKSHFHKASCIVRQNVFHSCVVVFLFVVFLLFCFLKQRTTRHCKKVTISSVCLFISKISKITVCVYRLCFYVLDGRLTSGMNQAGKSQWAYTTSLASLNHLPGSTQYRHTWIGQFWVGPKKPEIPETTGAREKPICSLCTLRCTPFVVHPCSLRRCEQFRAKILQVA